MIAVVRTSGSIESVWNDDKKDLAIDWAGFLVGRGWHVAVVDSATLDATAVEEAHRKQEAIASHAATLLGLIMEEETP